MKTRSDTAQRQAAKKFVEYWTFQRGSEKGEDQQFWNSLLGEVLAMDDVKSHVQYQVPVPMKGTTKFLDAWIPETRVLIEHKSRGVSLDAPQAGHGGLTPYDQAAEYDAARPFDEKARWIVTCNFDEFRIYDRAKPLAPPLTLKLGNLPKEAYRLAFLVNPKEKAIDRELEISVQAGRIVGEIYDALLGQYCGGRGATALPGDGRAGSPLPADEHLAALNRLCVRLVFCLYAEDADIFPKDCFRRLLENTPSLFLRERLLRLFQTLDTPTDKRNPYLDAELCAFPYTNGGLFKVESVKCKMENEVAASTGVDSTLHFSLFTLHSLDDIPPISDEIRQLLIGASQFDWREITPTIFGALFESTLNPVTRRSGGMVYTSVENIHKVIDPLFLDDLTRRVEAAIKKGDKRTLLALQAEMASRTFLDPACGSGNFLTETYICLRRLENRIIAALQKGQAELDLGISIKISITQFYGLEINDFAVAVAKAALWIAESQMKQETAEILHREPDYLPLKDNANIVECNALRTNWPRTDYIIGNPPFRGASNMSDEQKTDAVSVFGKGHLVNSLDLVGAWFHKAAQCGPGPRCAFVATNSIAQGEQVAPLWKPLVEKYGVEIDFAHRTFRWDNEAFDKAHVHCVIIGFHNSKTSSSESKLLFSTVPDPTEGAPRRTKVVSSKVSHINAYLAPAEDVFVESSAKQPAGRQKMTLGNKPADNGNLILTPDERAAILSATPALEPYALRYVGAKDLIHEDVIRYCLWLKDASPAIYHTNREVMRRIAAVREFRLASTSSATRKAAETPWKFFFAPHNGKPYLIIPATTSERREYVPIAFMPGNVIASNSNQIIPDATPYDFGVLTSSVHKLWLETVGGRLKSDFRYSGGMVYNTFPWPDDPVNPVNPVKEKITATAQGILDARAAHPDCSLAVLYDPLTMPSDLRAAHEANDKAVLAAYGLAPDTPEPEIVAHLFKLYAEKVKWCG